MDQDATIVFNGFLNLPNRERLQVVNAINDYFDNLSERESIRAEHDRRFAEIDPVGSSIECKCCGKK